MKNQIVSLFIKREHLIFLSKIQPDSLILDMDLQNQKTENRIIKTERWPQSDLDYFQNTFTQIANLAFSYFKMHFPVNSALQIRDHIKFTQLLKQINYGGVTLEEVFKHQRLRLVNSFSLRLCDEVTQCKFSKLDYSYIAILQTKYFNSRNPDYKIPYVILNLKPTEMKMNARPNRDFSVSQFEDVPLLQVLNTTLIQPILNFETLMCTFDYKLNKLMQRNQGIGQTIKIYQQKIKTSQVNNNEIDGMKQLFHNQIQNGKETQEVIKTTRQIILNKQGNNRIRQLKIDTDLNNNTNESERQKSLMIQSQVKVNKNQSINNLEEDKINKIQQSHQRIKKRLKNYNTEILNLHQSASNEESYPQVKPKENSPQKKSIKINLDDNIRSLTQYAVDDSFKVEKVYQYKSCNNSKSIAEKAMTPKHKVQQDSLESGCEKYKLRRSQYAPVNRESDDGMIESMKQLSNSKRANNVSLEKLTLRPIDYISVCTGNQKMKQLNQYSSPIKPKRFQTQEKEDNALKDILKLKKQSNQNLRNALILLTCARSEQLLTSLIASGTIKHQQYQSFLQPIKINSTAKYLTPK